VEVTLAKFRPARVLKLQSEKKHWPLHFGPCPRALPTSYEYKAHHNLHYDGPLVRRRPYHGALTLNLISLGTVEDNGWFSAIAFIAHTLLSTLQWKVDFLHPYGVTHHRHVSHLGHKYRNLQQSTWSTS
jgi:hypothetical protein